MPAPIVYIIDDDDALREALCFLLDSVDFDYQSFASADTFLAFVEDSTATLQQRPSCIITDVRMPGTSGLALQAELKRKSVHLPIIFITGHGDIPMAVDAIKAGAVDFLQKPFREQALLDCIDSALAKYEQTAKPNSALPAFEEQLTPKELQVLSHLRQGKAGKVIAAELGISPKTFDIHRSNILKKFSVPSVQKLLALYAN